MQPTANDDQPGAPALSEALAWQSRGKGWRPPGGSCCALGFSVEWHDFTTERSLDRSPSFHPDSVESRLNLAGHGDVRTTDHQLELSPSTAGFYFQDQPRLSALRTSGGRHQFLTQEFSTDFLARYIDPKGSGLHPALRDFLSGKSESDVSRPIWLTTEYRQIALQLCQPAVPPAAQRVWYCAKVLEVASSLLFQPPVDGELFCQRQKRLNHERVEKVISLLRENLAEPLSLEEIGRRMGCSHFHLSRIFLQEMGCGVFQHLRTLRMERAAADAIRQELVALYPSLASMRNQVRFAHNGEFASPATLFSNMDEIAMIPPVSGG